MIQANKIIILENIRSLHNVGSILRTADGAGWNEIILGGYTGCPPDRRIEKVSLGAEDFIKWKKVNDLSVFCQQLKKDGFFIVAIEQTKESQNIFKTKINHKKIAIILGNEVEGVSSELLALADIHLEIPMYGKKSSLNVSVATGIVLYALN